MSTQLKGEVRKDTRRSANNQLRKEGRIPASVYGKKLSAASIAVSEKEVLALLKKNPNAVVELDVPSVGKHPVMINEIQRDKMNGNVLHIDFHQISMNEPVKALVLIEIVGEAAGVKEGGVQQVLLHEVEVKCLPGDLPASLPIDVSGLGVGENLLVSDLSVPDKVELLTEASDVIVSILAPVREAEEAEADAAGEPAAEGGDAAAEDNSAAE